LEIAEMPPELEDELDLEEALELDPLYYSRGGHPRAYENKLWRAPEYEAPIPKTIHRLDCGAGCPGGLTEAQCAPVVSRAIIVAIDLAKNAASKVDQATVTGPLTAAGQKAAQIFKNFFGHDPRTELTFDGKKERSGVSIAKRFRSVAKELAGGRQIIFRCVPAICPGDNGSNGGDATHPPCCADQSRAFFDYNPALRNVVHLCPPFWNLPEASRGGTILHEMLHMLYGNGASGLHDTGRRANAHCYQAFALKIKGHARDLCETCTCWDLPEDECRRRLGLPPGHSC
jgi:hypothetical protein